MKILFLYHENVDDKNKLSGTVNSIYDMLVGFGNEVIVVSDLKYPLYLNIYNKVKHKLLRKKNIGLNMNVGLLKSYAHQIQNKTKNLDYDVVFCPVSSYYAYYVDEKPTVFFIDSNVGCLVDYYWKSSDYLKSDVKKGFELETLALKHTTLAIYASNWARDAAIKYHEGDPDKIVAINRGANVRHKLSAEQIKEIVLKRNIPCRNGRVQLLFVGKDWERKRGEIACKVVKSLNDIGVEAKLIVIGCTPSIPSAYRDFVDIQGFLDKNKTEEYKKIEEAYSRSDFFILPTQAEAQGISFIEAAAWGTPPIGCATGGVGDVVIEGITGLLIPVDAEPEEYAERIKYYVENPDEYCALANSAFDYYTRNMSWEAVGRRIFEELDKRIR